MPDVLCVDDDPESAGLIAAQLRELGYGAQVSVGLVEAVAALDRRPFDVVLVSLPLAYQAVPGNGAGADALETLRAHANGSPMLATAGHPDPAYGVAAIDRGALDYLTRPVRREALRLAVKHALEVGRLRHENERFRRELGAPSARELIGHSCAVRSLLGLIATVAPTRASVLLEGESGTGKELFARAIHEASPRRDRPLVSVNCAALPEGLVESTLFGHERGAFTGAAARTAGAFERADGGTLLLDEISEMRLDLQAKLLRALQEQEFERVGGHESVRVDVRLVATTNCDLSAEVQAGRFRRDLYYRIRVVPIRVPPLRERIEDVPLLTHHFVRRVAGRLGIEPPTVPESVIARLMRRTWPGNVRELENAVERAVILSRGRSLRAELFELAEAGPEPRGRRQGAAPDEEMPLNLREAERRLIERALEASGGSRTIAAQLLGISDRTLRAKLNPVRRE